MISDKISLKEKIKKNYLEVLAVIFSIGYTALITYGIEAAWACGIIGASLYFYICFQKKLYAETTLQLFYIATAIYGWYNWSDTGGIIIRDWTINDHLQSIGIGIVGVLIVGFLLKKFTDAALPYIDSFTTVFAIIATLLMITLVHENWLYFIVIDAISVLMYYKRGLKLTSILFVIYTLLSINAYFQWS